MTDNTRLHPRYEIRVSAEITLHSGEAITCLTRDLSLGGVGLDAERPLMEGAEIAMELFVVVDDIEDETTLPLRVPGRVVWCRMKSEHEFLAGVQFMDMSPEKRAYLGQLVAATAAAQAAP